MRKFSEEVHSSHCAGSTYPLNIFPSNKLKIKDRHISNCSARANVMETILRKESSLQPRKFHICCAVRLLKANEEGRKVTCKGVATEKSCCLKGKRETVRTGKLNKLCRSMFLPPFHNLSSSLFCPDMSLSVFPSAPIHDRS